MAELRAEIKAALAADTTLVTLLAGGVHSVKINRQETPSAFDSNKELLPCCQVAYATSSPFGPHYAGSREFFDVLFYQNLKTDKIDAARQRVYQLLHRQQVGAHVWEIQHADDVLDQEDEPLRAKLIVSRYVAYQNRV